jgi:hypothetical protein
VLPPSQGLQKSPRIQQAAPCHLSTYPLFQSHAIPDSPLGASSLML